MSEQKTIVVIRGGSPCTAALRAALADAEDHGFRIVERDDTAAVMAILGNRIDQDEDARKSVQFALDTILKNHAADRPRLLSDKQRTFLIDAYVAASEQDQRNDDSFIASAVKYGQDALHFVPDPELLYRSLVEAHGLNQMDHDDQHRTLLMLATSPGILSALISACTPQDLGTLMEDVNDAVAEMSQPAGAAAEAFAGTIAEAVRVANTVAEPDSDEHPAP